MPIVKRWAYFDHAAVSPLPTPTVEALSSWCDEATHQGDTVWPSWNRAVEATRKRAAAIVGAHNDEIALVPSTTSGLSLVAEGFPWQSGDNVVTLMNEFPSNLYPWMNLAARGVETRRVPVHDGRVSIQNILDACDQRTRLVSVSWVGYASGYRLDLAAVVEAVHHRGAYVMLDAIQGLGVFPLDVKEIPVDFLAADGHKWMLGPEGAGILFLRKAHLDLIRATGVGWNSVAHNFDFARIELVLKESAARFEGGTLNTAGFLALGASLKLLMDQGLSSTSTSIADQIHRLTDYACERLQSVGAGIVSDRAHDCWSGIVSFRLPQQDHDAVRAKCLQAGVVLSRRGGCLRMSPHAYNNEQDIDRMIDVLKG